MALRETHRLARRQNVEGPAAARARPRAACGGGEGACRSERAHAQLVDIISRIVGHNKLCDGSPKNSTCAAVRARNLPGKTQHVEGEISIVQAIQLGFLRSLGSAISKKQIRARFGAQRKPSPYVIGYIIGTPFGLNQ